MKTLYPVLAAFLFIAAIAGIAYCNRKPEPVPTVPAEQARQRIINTDSIRSAIETEYRSRELAQIKADSARYANWKANYKPKAQSAATAVQEWQKQPTTENCGKAIEKLQIQVSELETGLSISDTIISRQRGVITSFAGTVARKDSVIVELSGGWKAANEENAKLAKKLRNRNKLLKFGGAVVGVIVAGLIVSK